MVKQHYLIVSLNGTEKRHKLKANTTYTLGRKGADILIREEVVSKAHAKLIVGKESITIQELGSVNGTQVDGKQIKPNQLCMLRKQMVVKLGEGDNQISIDFEEVDSCDEESRSRSREKEQQQQKQTANEKKVKKENKLWTMGGLSKEQSEKMKKLMGAKDCSDDEQQVDTRVKIDKRNKDLEQQFKVALLHKGNRSAGLGF